MYVNVDPSQTTLYTHTPCDALSDACKMADG